MPNLGYDASEISYKPELYRRLRQIPFRQICYEMYKCMNVVKAIHAAGYIHGDIRETNILCNVDNAKMTIIDFDWLKPFNEIYNTYPEFYYPYPPECLFIFGRKKQHKYDINIKSLFRADMSVRSNDTILKFYETVINKYDYYIPQDATNGMRNFLNTIKPFQTTARNQNEWYEDIENYENNTRFELFNIAKDYIDMYGLGIAFYRLLKHTWGSNVLIQGINVNNGVVIELKDLSEGMKNGTIIMSGIDKNDVKEIEAFSNMRKFIFEELLPGMCHSNYARRWTIDEAIDIFREKLEEIGVDMRSNDEKLASDELKRMELLALIRNNKYEGVNNNGAIISKIKPKYYNESNPFAIFANNNNNNNKTNGGKRYKGKRKTRKNRRN
jgi:serine/threonine protein kinase